MMENIGLEPCSLAESTIKMPCSICGSYTDHEFKQGFVCEECVEYICSKIELNERAFSPTSYPERS